MKNDEIVRLLPEKEKYLERKLALEKELEEVKNVCRALERVTEVYKGVALHVLIAHDGGEDIYPTDTSLNRQADLFGPTDRPSAREWNVGFTENYWGSQEKKRNWKRNLTEVEAKTAAREWVAFGIMRQ